MSKTLNSINELITYNFGADNSSLINVWSLASHLYNQNFDNKIVAQKLLEASYELSLKIYGGKSKQTGEILLDLSKITRSHEKRKS